jgi:hypothetical protein
MSIRIDATKKLMALAYTGGLGGGVGGTFFGVGTGAPDSDQPPQEAASGAGLTYERAAIHWAVDDEGVATGTCHINVDPGSYTHAILFSDADSDSMFDYCPIALPMLTAGEVVLSATYTQS